MDRIRLNGARRPALAAVLILIAAALSSGQERGLSVVAKQVTGDQNFDIGKQYAVIIGIDAYTEWPSLKGAATEAKTIKSILQDRYYIDQFIELYDKDATAASIRKLFADDLPSLLKKEDSVLVFYAGHGFLDKSRTGFWIASDGTRDQNDQRGWIPNAQLRNYIGGLKAQRVLVIADSCFSGDVLNVNRGLLPEVNSVYFKKALQLTARQVLTSGASESVPDESEFGRQLINFLERNTEPLIDPITIYDRIRLGVSQTQPMLGTLPGNEQGASFVLFLKPEAQAPAAGTAAATSATPSASPTPATSAASEGDNTPATLPRTGGLRPPADPAVSRLRDYATQKTALSDRLKASAAARNTKRIIGWSGLGAMALCGVASGVSYAMGSGSYKTYLSATGTAEASAKASTEMAAGLTWLFGGLCLASGGAGSYFLFDVESALLRRDIDQLDAQIRALAK